MNESKQCGIPWRTFQDKVIQTRIFVETFRVYNFVIGQFC